MTPVDPTYPKLAGQYADYLEKALRDYQSGGRKNPIMITRRQLLLLSTAAFGNPLRAQTTTSIRIGEINSYSTIPQFTVPYRMGWQLAVEEINAAGGLIGRKVEVISRDDAGKPDDAIRLATELVSSEKVALLTGTFLSNVGLAVAEFALRNKVLFVAAEPLTDALVWEKGNRYTFRLRPSTYMDVVFGFARRVLVLSRGRLIADGAPDSVRTDPAVQAVYLGREV